jgi:ADP-ribose pyrophosphatase
VNVIAVTEDGLFLCFRQVKYGVEGTTLAPVGGFLAPGEEPLEAGRRELLEETGYEAAEWIDLGTYRVDPNRGIAMAHLFLARGAHRVAEPHSDDLEEQQLLHLTRAEVERGLAAGDVKVLAWTAAFLLALRHMEG